MVRFDVLDMPNSRSQTPCVSLYYMRIIYYEALIKVVRETLSYISRGVVLSFDNLYESPTSRGIVLLLQFKSDYYGPRYVSRGVGSGLFDYFKGDSTSSLAHNPFVQLCEYHPYLSI